MDPKRPPSVRSGRSLHRKPSFAAFRDDTKIVTVAYDKTVAAKPPIPILGANTRRSSRPTSAASSGSTICLHRGPSRSGPIVVVSPPSSMQPPVEQHPALRRDRKSKATAAEEWKRDSGHAAVTSPTPTTIHECDEKGLEDDQDGFPFFVAQEDRNVATKVADGVEQSPSVLDNKCQDPSSLYPTWSNRSWSTKHQINTTESEHDHQRRTSTDCGRAPSPGAEPTTKQAVFVLPGGDEADEPSAREQLMGAKDFPTANEASCVAADRTFQFLPKSPTRRLSKRPPTPPHNASQPCIASSLPSSPPSSSPTASPPAPFSSTFKAPKRPAMKLQKKRRKIPDPGDADGRQQEEQQVVEEKDGGSDAEQGASPKQWGGPCKDAKPALVGLQGPQFQAISPKPSNLRDDSLDEQGFSSSIRADQQAAPSSTTSPLHPTINNSSVSRPNTTIIPSRFWHRPNRTLSGSAPSRPASPEPPFASLAEIDIDTDSLLEHGFIANLSFSKRGSIMLGGERLPFPVNGATESKMMATDTTTTADMVDEPLSSPEVELVTAPQSRGQSALDLLDEGTTTSPPAAQTLTPPQPKTGSDSLHVSKQRIDPANLLKPPPDTARALAPDIEKESERVRSLYAGGDAVRWDEGGVPSNGERLETTPEVPSAEEKANDVSRPRLSPRSATPKSANSSSRAQDDSAKRELDFGGTLEDYDNLDGAEVDRYGFITTPRPASARLSTPTEMKSVQYSPRRGRNVLHKRDPAHYSASLSSKRIPSRKVSARSLNTVNSEVSFRSMRSTRSVVRQAGNLLPHNRDRRWMDEAGDMLAISPSMQDVAEEARMAQITDALKKKEWERAEKWRKMAKAKKGAHGEGMEFDFDTKNPKLIERTWKGIPDLWRAAAWWSFMATSARNHPNSPSQESIIADFHRLQDLASPDDVQIDLDVPRTISRHIMFRRRYRGGQRLLFRVLHAISIYYPQTGYVQGMASLAATLLSYFDEEKTFVMLVRMWQLRGLDRLYRPGFEGLMAALSEFETTWINKDVAKKLTELCVDSTAYGTRWYLTLFNLSIPFPAQLRIWDVFLLLGDTAADPIQTAQNGSSSKDAKGVSTTPNTGLDILHAASAALVQALREVLLDSEFENAMRALTSFIPVKDEELLMKVAKAEWKMHQGKKKS